MRGYISLKRTPVVSLKGGMLTVPGPTPEFRKPKPRFQVKNNYFAEMSSGSEEDSYLRLIDFLFSSALGLRVIKKKKTRNPAPGCVMLRPQRGSKPTFPITLIYIAGHRIPASAITNQGPKIGDLIPL